MMASVRSRTAVLLALGALLAPSRLGAEPGQLLARVPFAHVSPQDIAQDTSDGSFWVTTFIDGSIHHLGADLQSELAVLSSPFPDGTFLTGIAFNDSAGTLLVTEAGGRSIIELDRDGSPTGREIPLALEPVPNANGFPTVRGLAFHAGGDAGRGSIYLVESLGTLIYEIALDGSVLRTFPHPDDPDGFPGEGASANATDIELVLEGGEVAGFYVTSSRGSEGRIVRLDAGGVYTGISIPLTDASGNVSGLLRRRLRHPSTGEDVDAFLCVVESNAKLALLEGGEPSFREVFALECEESGSRVTMTWTTRDTYAAVEVLDGCDRVATLPGDAVAWEGELAVEGEHALTVRVRRGDEEMETAPCIVVLGPGQARRGARFEAERPVDLAWDGGGLLYVTEAFSGMVRALDVETFADAGHIVLDPAFAAEGEVITGIAAGEASDRLYVYNTTRHAVALVDLAGEVLESFTAELPDIAEPPPSPGEEDEEGEEPEIDRGVVIGMAFDPRGDGGKGSLWVVEAVEDILHEIGLTGRLLRSLPHPYHDAVRIPEDAPYGVYSSGVALVHGASPARLLVSGGSATELGQRRIFELDVASGRVLDGSEIPTSAVRREAGDSSLALEHVPAAAGSRLLVLPYQARHPEILELDSHRAAATTPFFVACRQLEDASGVEIRFAGGPYNSVEILRDCSLVAVLPGDARSFIDSTVVAGARDYGVRGVKDGATSDTATCRLRVGPGAVLQQAFAWPARSPQQITRDPVDGSFIAVVNWPGDERLLFTFDSDLRFLAVRESTVAEPWEIATLAVRAPAGEEPLLYSIAWQQPVPLGGGGRETILLVIEDFAGEQLDAREIDPPRPQGGFVTYPTALAWNEASDSFYYLERNSRSFVEMAPDGAIVRVFPHPDPPYQSFVFNIGLAVAPGGESLFITGADRDEHRVAKIVEMTTGGALTGLELSLREVPGVVRGMTFAGSEIVLATQSAIPRLLRLQAFPIEPALFIRGDADDSGRLTIADPMLVLRRLFLGGDPLPAPYPDPGGDPTPDALRCGG